MLRPEAVEDWYRLRFVAKVAACSCAARAEAAAGEMGSSSLLLSSCAVRVWEARLLADAKETVIICALLETCLLVWVNDLEPGGWVSPDA